MTATMTKPATTKTPAAKAAPKNPRKPKPVAKPLPTGLPLMIGLDKLAADPMNVRPDAGDVGELAASIAAHGVIQPLAVRPEVKPPRDGKGQPKQTGRYLVVAGGRRLRALLKLAGDRRLPKDAGVPCVVRQGTERDATEVSLAENVERLPMNPADEHAAFAKLADAGMSSTGHRRPLRHPQAPRRAAAGAGPHRPGPAGRASPGRHVGRRGPSSHADDKPREAAGRLAAGQGRLEQRGPSPAAADGAGDEPRRPAAAFRRTDSV